MTAHSGGPAPRRRRRAVGPAGGVPTGGEPDLGLHEAHEPPAPADDERLRADRPPHHDRGV